MLVLAVSDDALRWANKKHQSKLNVHRTDMNVVELEAVSVNISETFSVDNSEIRDFADVSILDSKFELLRKQLVDL